MMDWYFVVKGDEVIHDAPTLTHEAVLLAAGYNADMVRVSRWEYMDVMAIEDVWSVSARVEDFRIMGCGGGYVWQTPSTLQKAIGEFCTRTNPYIPVSQRAVYIERIRKYRKDEIEAALKGIYGDLLNRKCVPQGWSGNPEEWDTR